MATSARTVTWVWRASRSIRPAPSRRFPMQFRALTTTQSATFQRSQPEIPPVQPTELGNSTTTFSEPAPSTPSERPLLSYHISRTRTNNIPVYTDTKGHGTQHILVLRKISGDVHALKKDLMEALGIVDAKQCVVTQPAGHVVIKGKTRGDVERWVRERGF